MASQVSLTKRLHPEMTQRYQTHTHIIVWSFPLRPKPCSWLDISPSALWHSPFPRSWSPQAPLPLCMYHNPAAMISLFRTGRTRPEHCLIRDMPALSLPAGTLCLLLPIHTPSVTREPSELHFYSGRHVRDRVRLHLRRVTDNNNDTLGTGEPESRSEQAPRPSMAEVCTEFTEH